MIMFIGDAERQKFNPQTLILCASASLRDANSYFKLSNKDFGYLCNVFACGLHRKSLLRQSCFLLPTLKHRLRSALRARGIEALKAIFNHPLVSIPIETIKGWVEAE